MNSLGSLGIVLVLSAIIPQQAALASTYTAASCSGGCNDNPDPANARKRICEPKAGSDVCAGNIGTTSCSCAFRSGNCGCDIGG
ncbi:hypothetical protein CA13_52450 [Planctomycetes bacterium CA13]|uniref:Uncharacterized protein n=1 Tax=Novipirellula herctigrandis TaxID=2527986 RepID=A0A5C5Z8Y0_9BACT|nr:hypothetical protein CA13_52450 [Planctomycetes bacterium CA13]